MRSAMGRAPLNQPMVAREFLDFLHASLLLYEELDCSQRPCYELPRTF